MALAGVTLIAGLGNPGNQYAESRHNAGFWLIQALQQQYGFTLKDDKRHKALTGSFELPGRTIRVIAPQTFMNLSGDSVIPFARFYKVPSNQMLIAYDELDLEPGVVRLKLEGGHGGHNGLRDIMKKSGANDMKRLRLGIGHPGDSRKVSGYVLSKPSANDRIAIESAISRSLTALPEILDGEFTHAMNFLHTDPITENGI
ncbi:MAG: aminoacyl-tRNA hydrolase [bacterium]